MATEQLTRVLRHVRQLIGLGRDDLTDSELLDRFVGRLDESAFEELVRRHGPMVQRTCRRVLGDAHAAEDAFQAVFLVLARKAGSIRQRRSIAGWLYEVAYNLALRARADAARRRLHERRASEMPKPLTALTNDPEMQAVLDEELHRLPEKYRTPLVLCYIEGKTNEEAARELGWPSGSMSYRLAQARELLRKRLSSRGLALPAGALLVLLTESAAPAVSATLVKTTVQAATSFAAGKAIAAGTVSAEALALAEGALHTMLTTKMKIAAGLLLAVGLLGSGARMFVHADPPAASPALAAADSSPKLPAAESPAGVDADGDPLPPGAVARLGTLRWRHNSPIMFLAYSADAKQIITATQDGVLRVLEANGGKEIRKFGKAPAAGAVPLEPIAPRAGAAMILPMRATLSGVALSADTKTLAVTSYDGSITLWEVATGKELRSFKSNPVVAISAVVFAPDGKSLFARGNDSSVRQFDVAEGKELNKLAAPAPEKPAVGGGIGFSGPFLALMGLGVAADGKTVLISGQENKNGQMTALIRSWEVATGKEQISRGPQIQGGFYGSALSPDGKLAAFSHFAGTIYVWDIAAGKEVQKIVGPQNNYPSALSFSADGKMLAVRGGMDQVIRLWSVAEGKELHKFGEAPAANPNGFVSYRGNTPSNLAFSADGSQLATGTEANTVRQFDTKTGKEIAAASGGHHGAVMSVALSPDGKTAITRETDGTTHLWAADSGKETKRYSLPANVLHAAFSADGKLLALGTQDGSVLLWDAVEGKELKSWKANAQPNQGFAALALSADGKTVATRGYDQIIHLWDAAGRELRQVADSGEANNNAANGVVVARIAMVNNVGTQGLVFSPDGTLLAGMATDRVEKPNGNPGIKLPIVNAVTTLRLWDVSTGKQVRKFEAPANTNISAFAFAPDGRTLASANYDSSISLWEAASGKERQRITLKPLVKAAAPAPADPKDALQPALAKAVMVRPFPGNAALNCIAFSPDGKVLVVAGQEGVLRFWDMVAGKERNTLKGHQSNITTLAFALNGKRIATGSADTTALVWDVPAEGEKAPVVQLETRQAEQLVDDLTSDDAAKAYQAIRTLSQVPAQAVPLLKARLQAVTPPDAQKVAQLITDLDSNTFVTRKKAEDELDKLGELAEDAIRKALNDKPNLEMQKRLEALLNKLVTGAAPNSQQLRTLRGLEVLESAGTPEAREVLKTLAKGAPGARVTKDAQNSLNRLGDR